MQGSAPSSKSTAHPQPAPLPGGASLFLLEPEVGFPIFSRDPFKPNGLMSLVETPG